MKAIKLLNDQDVLVYGGTRFKWNRDLGSLRNLVENTLGLLVYGGQLEASPSSSLIRTRMLLLRGTLVS